MPQNACVRRIGQQRSAELWNCSPLSACRGTQRSGGRGRPARRGGRRARRRSTQTCRPRLPTCSSTRCRGSVRSAPRPRAGARPWGPARSTGGRRAGRGTGGSGLTTLNTLADTLAAFFSTFFSTFSHWPHAVLGAPADCDAPGAACCAAVGVRGNWLARPGDFGAPACHAQKICVEAQARWGCPLGV